MGYPRPRLFHKISYCKKMECAANCWTSELQETPRFITVCLNGHKMHAECIRKLFILNTNPNCPLCRDDTLTVLRDIILKNPFVKDESSDESYSDSGSSSLSLTDVTDEEKNIEQEGINFNTQGGAITINIYGEINMLGRSPLK